MALSAMSTVRTCEWRPCRRTFVPTGPEHYYCTRKHAEKARVARRKAEVWDPNTSFRCPKRYKRVFRSWDEAVTHLALAGLKGVFPYRCPCAAIHVGHPSRMPSNERATWEFKIAVRREQLLNMSADRGCRHRYVSRGVCAVCARVLDAE